MTLKINNKLFAISGCIGRREYFINLMLLNIFVSFMCLPFTLWMLKHSANGLEIFDVKSLLMASPMFCKFFYILGCLVSLVVCMGLVVRRIVDIRGVEADWRVKLMGLLLVLVPYSILFNFNPWACLGLLIVTILGLIILFLPGKITSQLPPDKLKCFNWGAFWGTWIWGLFNKSYITLLSIPLFFTSGFFSWALICGFKGNEWAFKNTQALDSEKFHQGQKHQAIFWNSLAGFFIFFLPIVVMILFVGIVAFSAKNPQVMEGVLPKAESAIETIIVSQFEDYELGAYENKFYIDPIIWANLTYSERYDLFKAVSSYASMKKMRSSDDEFANYHGTRTDEMRKTKFYSTYNGEILAEFEFDETRVNSFYSAVKEIMKGLKLNPNPQLPPTD